MVDDFEGKPNGFKLKTECVIIISVCLPKEIYYMRESHVAALRTVTVIFISDQSVLLEYGEY